MLSRHCADQTYWWHAINTRLSRIGDLIGRSSHELRISSAILRLGQASCVQLSCAELGEHQQRATLCHLRFHFLLADSTTQSLTH